MKLILLIEGISNLARPENSTILELVGGGKDRELKAFNQLGGTKGLRVFVQN